jgi:hypothetical protein
MALRKVEKTLWHAFFDGVSRALVGKRAEVEVASLAIGDLIEAEWLPFLGITYEPKTDMVEIELEGLDHVIAHPREVVADGTVFELANVTIKDNGDALHIVRLRDPLMLPPPNDFVEARHERR